MQFPISPNSKRLPIAEKKKKKKKKNPSDHIFWDASPISKSVPERVYSGVPRWRKSYWAASLAQSQARINCEIEASLCYKPWTTLDPISLGQPGPLLSSAIWSGKRSTSEMERAKDQDTDHDSCLNLSDWESLREDRSDLPAVGGSDGPWTGAPEAPSSSLSAPKLVMNLTCPTPSGDLERDLDEDPALPHKQHFRDKFTDKS